MRNIWVTFTKEGIHKYPAALTDPALATGDEYDVSFLGYPHRHTFYFKVWIEVYHNDRDIEFIQFKRWLEKLYNESVIQLDYKSCEMIADDLAKQIQRKYPNRDIKISVAEDNENGCEIDYPYSDVSIKDRSAKEGSWYEGGNPHKDDGQDTYVPGIDD
jgi:hypothetical protein|tara:strand:+ start:192 stop:668 length:477 start_codon:yes stop_codon:yes gene_type:complete